MFSSWSMLTLLTIHVTTYDEQYYTTQLQQFNPFRKWFQYLNVEDTSYAPMVMLYSINHRVLLCEIAYPLNSFTTVRGIT